MHRFVGFIVAAVLFTSHLSPLTAQQPASGTRVAHAISGEVMRAHLEFLADDALEGRAPGTRGGISPRNISRRSSSDWGSSLSATDRTYFHKVPIISLTPNPTLAVQGGEAPLALKKDFVMWSMRTIRWFRSREISFSRATASWRPNTGGTTTRGST